MTAEPTNTPALSRRALSELNDAERLLPRIRRALAEGRHSDAVDMWSDYALVNRRHMSPYYDSPHRRERKAA